MTQILHAETAQSTPTATSAPSPFASFFPLVVIFAIFYLLLIRPQQKKMKDHKKMLDSLQKGDEVLTSSGIYGTVLQVGDKNVDLRIGENLRVKMLKSAVSEVLRREENGTQNPPTEKKNS